MPEPQALIVVKGGQAQPHPSSDRIFIDYSASMNGYAGTEESPGILEKRLMFTRAMVEGVGVKQGVYQDARAAIGIPAGCLVTLIAGGGIETFVAE